ncbi:hypothetical protein ACMD2_10505 [Ananas comosus]|uniref:Uncharacterized protein n=1 Tax=Ananas comosus TaxID=4615 RepID=A0A199UT25_ANACO|nr:hypothetical protein ACMD2_10505 [Ananas comosus]
MSFERLRRVKDADSSFLLYNLASPRFGKLHPPSLILKLGSSIDNSEREATGSNNRAGEHCKRKKVVH